jgi:hypothetical protein
MRGIRFRRGVYLMVGVMLVLAMSACSSSDSEEIYGVWITPGPEGLHMSFSEDGSWSVVQPDADPDLPSAFGTFTFDGELLTFTTDPASRNCSPNSGTGIAADAVGIYEAAFTDEGDLVLNDVDEPCVQARVQTRGTLVRYSP